MSNLPLGLREYQKIMDGIIQANEGLADVIYGVMLEEYSMKAARFSAGRRGSFPFKSGDLQESVVNPKAKGHVHRVVQTQTGFAVELGSNLRQATFQFRRIPKLTPRRVVSKVHERWGKRVSLAATKRLSRARGQRHVIVRRKR